MTHRRRDAGLTLVEVLVALAIFALVGTAAMTVLTQSTRSSETANRKIAQLEDLQIAFRLMGLDMMQMTAGSLDLSDDGIALRRTTRDVGAVGVRYGWDQSELTRSVTWGDGATVTQVLVRDLAGADLRLFRPQAGWAVADDAPAADATGLEVVLTLTGPDQSLRRVFPVIGARP